MKARLTFIYTQRNERLRGTIIKQGKRILGWSEEREIIEEGGIVRIRNSSVGIATRYGLDGPGIESRWWWDFLYPSRPALGPTQPSVQWVPGLSRGVKRPGRGADPPPPSKCRDHERVELYLYWPSWPQWPVTGRTFRRNSEVWGRKEWSGYKKRVGGKRKREVYNEGKERKNMRSITWLCSGWGGSRRPFIAEAWIRSQVRSCGIYSEQNDTWTGFFSSAYVFLCHCNSVNGPYSFIRLSQRLHNYSGALWPTTSDTT